MTLWKSVWTVVWFAGLILFAAIALVVIVQGARDLRDLLRQIDRGKRDR